jgi:hypothetical protein
LEKLYGALVGALIGSIIIVSVNIYQSWRNRKKSNHVFSVFSPTLRRRLTLTFILAGAVIAISASGNVPSYLTLHEMLSRIVVDLNKENPKKLDAMTTLQNVQLEGEKRLIYFYSLSIDGSQVDLSALLDGMKKESLKNWCRSSDTEEFRKFNVEVTYRYLDNNGSLIGDVPIKTQDCPR